MELTDREKALLCLMLKNFDNIINFTDMGYIEIDGKTFNSHDVFYLAEKLEISDFM